MPYMYVYGVTLLYIIKVIYKVFSFFVYFYKFIFYVAFSKLWVGFNKLEKARPIKNNMKLKINNLSRVYIRICINLYSVLHLAKLKQSTRNYQYIFNYY